MASVPALVSRSDAVKEMMGCAPSASEGTQPRHTPPSFSWAALSKATFAPFAESSTEAISMRSSMSHGSPSASTATDFHVQMAQPAWEPFSLSGCSVSTTTEPSVLRRRHPEVRIVARASEKRWQTTISDEFATGLRACGKEFAVAGVAQAARDVPVASALQSAATGKRFLGAMVLLTVRCSVLRCLAYGLRLMCRPRHVSPAPAVATPTAMSCRVSLV